MRKIVVYGFDSTRSSYISARVIPWASGENEEGTEEEGRSVGFGGSNGVHVCSHNIRRLIDSDPSLPSRI